MSDLEQKFRDAVAIGKPLIEAKLEEAAIALAEAEELADAYGLPFNSSVSFMSQEYTPLSAIKLREEFEKTNEEEKFDELVEELTGVYGLGEYAGWEHSAVC